MTAKRSILVLCVFLALFFTYLTDRRIASIKKQRAFVERRLLPFFVDDIVGFELNNEYGHVRCEKVDGQWLVIEPIEEEGAQRTIETMLENLVGAKKRSKQKVSESQLSEFGLDKPALSLILFSDKTPESFQLFLGHKSPFPNQLYARSSEKAEIFSVSQHIRNVLSKSLLQLRDRTIFDLPILTANDMEFSYADSAIQIIKSDTNRWRVEKPMQERADDEFVGQFLSKLSGRNIERFYDDPKPLSDYGLDKPFFRMVVTVDSKHQTLLVGNHDEEGNAFFAMVEGRQKVFSLSNDLVDSLMVNLYQVRNKYLFDLPIETITEMDFVTGKRELYLRKDASGIWALRDEPDTKLNQQKIGEVLLSIRYLKATGFQVEKPSPQQLEEFELDAPMIRCRISDGETIDELQIGAKPSGRNIVFCKKANRENVLTADVRMVGMLYLGRDDVIDKSLLHVDSALISKVTITTYNKEFTITKEADSWQMILMPDKLIYRSIDKECWALLMAIVAIQYDYRADEAANSPSITGLDNPTLTIVLHDEKGEVLAAITRGDIVKENTFVDANDSSIYIVKNAHFKKIERALARLVR